MYITVLHVFWCESLSLKKTESLQKIVGEQNLDQFPFYKTVLQSFTSLAALQTLKDKIVSSIRHFKNCLSSKFADFRVRTNVFPVFHSHFTSGIDQVTVHRRMVTEELQTNYAWKYYFIG